MENLLIWAQVSLAQASREIARSSKEAKAAEVSRREKMSRKLKKKKKKASYLEQAWNFGVGGECSCVLLPEPHLELPGLVSVSPGIIHTCPGEGRFYYTQARNLSAPR